MGALMRAITGGADMSRMLTIMVVMVLALTSCILDRSGTRPPEPVKWDVVPQYFCPGDPVTVSWDFSEMNRSPENCHPRNGGYDSLTSCSSSAVCSADGVSGTCLDGYCCRSDIYMENYQRCETPGGCYGGFDITITADTLTLEPPVDSESRAVRGSRTVTPSDTVTFNLSGGISDPAALFDENKTAQMVTAAPETDIALDFPFLCNGTRPGWGTVDLAQVTTAEHVRIAGVRNTSGHVIILTGGDPERGPVTLAPGEVTTAFNGRVGGVWMVGLSPVDRSSLRVPRCLATDVEDPWPDLQVQAILECWAE